MGEGRGLRNDGQRPSLACWPWIWDTPGVVLKTREGYPCAPAMNALCCAACLHAITDPERPVQFDGCFFHASHLPAAAVGWF
jgi:hypothetical protein